ncbi:MAG TPA: hypothetical protein PKH10_02145 [bacterium]|nr:hypothetical protein [bacterium]
MTKFLLMILSVLCANLLSGALSSLVLAKVRGSYSMAIATAVGMLVLVAVLYPLYRYLNSWATALSQFFLRTGKKMFGRILGLLLVFLALLALLYYGYARLWFGVNIYAVLFGNFV